VPRQNLGPHVWCIHMASCRAYAGIEVHDHDRSKWYPHTTVILSLAFQNLTSKATACKEFYLKQRMIWISNISFWIPYSCFNKEYQNPKLCQNRPMLGVKTTFKGGFWKSFLPLTSYHQNSWPISNVLKTLLLFQNDLRKNNSNPFVCVIQNNI